MSRHAHHPESDQARERLLDLLSQRATEGLNAAEEIEVARLLAAHPDVDEPSFELAAAAATLALIDADTEAPAALPEPIRQRTRQLATAQPAKLVGPSASSSARFPSTSGGAAGLIAGPTRVTARSTPELFGRSLFRLGWLAAAAAVLVAAVGWWQALAPSSSRPQTSTAMLAEYQEFAASAPDLVRWKWVGKEPGFEGVRGQVVWSDTRQQGYMLLSGLRMNDPSREQYQLWIVDPNRDKNPVDGGVFNIAAAAEGNCTTTGEVIVPIDCKLPVSQPAAFALTVEKPGGVVVSAGPLVVVAAR